MQINVSQMVALELEPSAAYREQEVRRLEQETMAERQRRQEIPLLPPVTTARMLP